jgi:hypothetical protein
VSEIDDMAESEAGPAGAHLWALELDAEELPVRAHLITRTEADGPREVRWSACGQRFTAALHPRGWWSTRPGELPLAEWAVHCGREVAGAGQA